jgi:hypothetical protein
MEQGAEPPGKKIELFNIKNGLSASFRLIADTYKVKQSKCLDLTFCRGSFKHKRVVNHAYVVDWVNRKQY